MAQALRSFGIHSSFFLLYVPGVLLLVSMIFGGIFATLEDWDFHEGMLYVGGDIVLLPLSKLSPKTDAGIVADFFISCFALGVLSWVVAIIGLLPICDSICTAVGAKHANTLVAISKSSILFLVIGLPVMFFKLSVIFAVIVMIVDGFTFEYALGLSLSLISHAAGLAPSSPGSTVAGHIVSLICALTAVGFVLGISVGVYLVFPWVGTLVDLVSKRVSDKGLFAKFGHFVVCVVIGMPLIVLPLAIVLGSILTAVEGWLNVVDGILYVGSSLVLIPLTSVVPTTLGGKIFDYFVSCFGIGVFGFVLAIIGALPFTDAFCEKLGGKSENQAKSYGFILAFFFIIMPITCFLVALPLGGILASGEGWSLADGWLFAASILVQAPSLAPAGAVAKTDGGRILVLIVAVYSLCVTLGWGAGIVVASSALDLVNQKIKGLFGRIEAAAMDSASDPKPDADSCGEPTIEV